MSLLEVQGWLRQAASSQADFFLLGLPFWLGHLRIRSRKCGCRSESLLPNVPTQAAACDRLPHACGGDPDEGVPSLLIPSGSTPMK